ncbi:N-acetylmuramidase [Ralstonia phage RP13]|nr:N-acetylmuramidase [Ralstonia phage RP13]
MRNIETELDALIGREGGYTNNPNDSGGETIWGITKFVAQSFGYTSQMKDMTRDQAKTIYRQRYWTQPKFDQVFTINPDIAFEMFDTGVNMGTGVASKFLQRALNVLNNKATLFPDMIVDGVIGNMSLNSLRTFLNLRKQDGVTVMLRMLNAQQSVKYIEIAEANVKNEEFEYGWQFNRVTMP